MYWKSKNELSSNVYYTQITTTVVSTMDTTMTMTTKNGKENKTQFATSPRHY